MMHQLHPQSAQSAWLLSPWHEFRGKLSQFPLQTGFNQGADSLDIDHRRGIKKGKLVADVACGTGWSSLALAAAYPGVRVDGFDLDEYSIFH